MVTFLLTIVFVCFLFVESSFESLKGDWLDDSSDMWEQIIMKSCQPFLCCLIVSTTVQEFYVGNKWASGPIDESI